MNQRLFSRFVIISTLLFITLPIFAAAQTPVLHIAQQTIEQGDPVMLTISGTTTLPTSSSPSLLFFLYKGTPTALFATDINQKIGTTTIIATWKNNIITSTSFYLTTRSRPQEQLAIPQQLGGNSVANQTRVVSLLEQDNISLAKIYSRKDKKLWTTPFAFPVTTPTVTDPYGYERDSGSYVITHKGVDFAAPIGTPVYAVNRGVVRVATNYATYGNTIVVDHGLGILSMYMHLSKILVTPGELIQKGQLIGLSGETGYSEGPHLHLTIRIGGISIDPMMFFQLVGEK